MKKILAFAIILAITCMACGTKSVYTKGKYVDAERVDSEQDVPRGCPRDDKVYPSECSD